MPHIFLLGVHFGFCQSADYPVNHPAYTISDYWAANGGTNFFTKFKPYSRSKTIELLKGQQVNAGVQGFNTNYLFQDSREWSGDSSKSQKSAGRFYEYPADLYSAKTKGFDLHVNPVVHLRVGKDSRSSARLYENNRGIELRAQIDDKIAVYTMLSENQTQFPVYVNDVRDSIGSIPQEGFWKLFGKTGSDFFRAEGYVDVGVTDHVSIQMGYGRHFVGDGQRSLILSDFGSRYPYIRIETEVWRIKYTNLFAQLIGQANFSSTGTLGSSEFPQKFMTMHHLDINVTDNLNIGLFESVIFGEPDSLGGGVKLQYLNPIIFYRALEQQDGSPDNVILGVDFNWHLWNRLTLYGQLVIDEMVIKEVFNNQGWWGNKQGVQLGAKYFDAFGVGNLMLQGEFNGVRPYTYSHVDGFTNYSHYNLPLAHPLGANFEEVIGKVDFQPFEKWRFQAVGVFAKFGDDLKGRNYGRDILRSYLDRDLNGNSLPDDDYGNDFLQGARGSLVMLNLRTTYHWKHNLFVDGDFILREEKGQRASQSTIFGLSF
ncbi:MAG: hypothetical protein GY816_00510, partial [Cytophagales bacterium]|nr:hypothetical protein [Cytophagales bacterium]